MGAVVVAFDMVAARAARGWPVIPEAETKTEPGPDKGGYWQVLDENDKEPR
jgi:hypothetical protein